MTWLVTGGAGFIGSALCHYLARETDQKIVVVDKLTYAGNRASIERLEAEGRLDLIEADIMDVPKEQVHVLTGHFPSCSRNSCGPVD